MMNKSLSTTEHAAYIRHTLKSEHGWNSRHVSVKARYYSMGSSIDVRIKDASVALDVVEAIANKAERIDRCEYSGEILSGGNRYVHVSYDADVLQAMGKAYEPAVEAASAELKTLPANRLVTIEGVPFMIGTTGNGYGLSVWSTGEYGSHIRDCYDVSEVARLIAIRMTASK